MIDKIIERFKQSLKYVLVSISLIIDIYYAALNRDSIQQRLISLVYTIVFFFLGIVMVRIVFGIQLKNPFMPKKSLRTFSNIFIIVLGLGFVLNTINFLTTVEQKSLWLLFVIMGAMTSIVNVRFKHILKSNMKTDESSSR